MFLGEMDFAKSDMGGAGKIPRSIQTQRIRFQCLFWPIEINPSNQRGVSENFRFLKIGDSAPPFFYENRISQIEVWGWKTCLRTPFQTNNFHLFVTDWVKKTILEILVNKPATPLKFQQKPFFDVPPKIYWRSLTDEITWRLRVVKWTKDLVSPLDDVYSDLWLIFTPPEGKMIAK